MKTFIEAQPDSALAALKRIDAQKLSGKEEKAKYALLLSMALDKNGIDKTDFEILHPAIDYYKNKGSLTEQMLTLFYQGQIHRINSQYAQALTCFCDAIEINNDSPNLS